MFKKIVFFAVLVSVFTSIGFAEEIVVLKNGQKVLLKENNTWVFVSNPEVKKVEDAYCAKVELRNERVGSLLDEPVVFGEIKNNGDRTLTKVELTLYFLDANNKPIFEDTYFAVSPEKVNDKPLKPGYERKFEYLADDVPSGWAKKVTIQVTGMEFEADSGK